MRCLVTAVAALALLAIDANADSPAEKFKTCARDAAIAEIKQAQQKGEITAPDGHMFVAVEPYVEKAYAACASQKPPGVTKPDGLPNDDIQDFVLTAVFDVLYADSQK